MGSTACTATARTTPARWRPSTSRSSATRCPARGPKGYFWEVHDKGGNVFWYGGKPDQGGPTATAISTNTNSPLNPTIDRSAIVTDDATANGVRWLLSAQRDVGVNQISYHYTTVNYQ